MALTATADGQTRADLIVRCRALDRVLQWNYYLVPNFNLSAFRIAYWNKFGMPDKRPDPLYSYGGTAWWVDPAKEAALAGKKTAKQALDDAVNRGNAMLRQFEKTVSR